MDNMLYELLNRDDFKNISLQEFLKKINEINLYENTAD